MRDDKKDEPDVSIEVTLQDIYDMLQNTHERLVNLEHEMKSKMETNGIPNDIDDLYGRINNIRDTIINLEKKIDSHIKWSEGESHGTIQTHKFWIKVLSGIVAILAVLQAIALFS